MLGRLSKVDRSAMGNITREICMVPYMPMYILFDRTPIHISVLSVRPVFLVPMIYIQADWHSNTIYRIYSYLSPMGLIYEVGLGFEFKPSGAYKRNVLILNVMCSTRLFACKPPPHSEYICTIDDLQGFTYSVLPYKVMYMTVYSHITKYHEETSCLSRHSSSPRSVRISFISPWGLRFEYKPGGGAYKRTAINF